MPVESTYVVCPLDAHHVILKKRIQTHLTKCERQHDMTKKSKCPYNLTHIVDTIVFPVSYFFNIYNLLYNPTICRFIFK